MAILIQKLTNIVNIIDDTRPAGQTIINSLSVDCVAKPIHKDPNDDQIQILDGDGLPTQTIVFAGTLKVQDSGGAPVVFVGTLDALTDKLNDEYFDNAVTSAGGGGGGDATAANQVLGIAELTAINTNTGTNATETTLVSLETKAATATKQDNQITELQSIVTNTGTNATQTTLLSIDTKVSTATKQDNQITELQTIVTNTTGTATATKQDTTITELQKLTGANAPSHQEITNPAAVVISAFKKLSFVCKGAISVTIDGNTIVYPQNLGGGAKIYGSDFEADDVSTNAATFNGTGKVFLTIKQ